MKISRMQTILLFGIFAEVMSSTAMIGVLSLVTMFKGIELGILSMFPTFVTTHIIALIAYRYVLAELEEW